MSFERIRAVADAVLLEGYVLYPYRASSAKNRFRWAFGVLAPRPWSEGPAGCEPWWMETQCLVEASAQTCITGRLRFLQLQRRSVEVARGGAFEPASALDTGEQLLLPWDEGEVREIELDTQPLATADTREQVIPFAVAGGRSVEKVCDASGAPIGRLVRTRSPVQGVIRIAAEAVGSDGALVRLRVRVENATPFDALSARRDEALASACLSTHLMLAVSDGAFVSLIDPPKWAAAPAAACRNVGTYPVLAGEVGRHDLVLSAPIILYDHPQIAPESPGDFFDATEIDELLTLRTSMLTEEEKRHARATDARAAAILDRVDHLPNDVMQRLHGAIRQLEAIETPAAEARFHAGDRVRLRPGARRTDAQDLLFAGRTATIEKIMQDVEGGTCLAVTIDGDPAAELHRWHGRFHYYYPDEVELLSSEPEALP